VAQKKGGKLTKIKRFQRRHVRLQWFAETIERIRRSSRGEKKERRKSGGKAVMLLLLRRGGRSENSRSRKYNSKQAH